MKYLRIFFIVFVILFFGSIFINLQEVKAQSCYNEGNLCFKDSECCSGKCVLPPGALYGNKRCAGSSPSSAATPVCPNPCSSSQSGTYRCDPSDNKKVQLCGFNAPYGSSCYSWGFFQNCSSSEVCSNGKCVSASTPPSSSYCSYVYKPYCQGGKEPQAIRDSRNCIIKYECPETQSAYGQTRPTISIAASKSSVKAGESFTIKLQASTTDSQGIDYINICEGATDCTRKMCSGAKQCDLSKDFVKNTKGAYTFQGFAKGKNGFGASNDGQAVTITVTDTSTPPPSSSTDPLIRADKNRDGKIDDNEMTQVLYDQTKGLYTQTEVEKIRELWVKGGTITPPSSATGDKVQAEVQCAQEEIIMKSSWESVNCWVNIIGPYQYFKWQLSGPAQMLGSGLGKETSIRINSPGEVIVKVILSDVYNPSNYKYSAQKTIKVLPPGSAPSNPEAEKSADFICTRVVNDTIEFKGSLPSSNYMDIKCTAKSRSAKSYLWETSLGIRRIVGAAIANSIWLRLYKEDIGKTFSLTLNIYQDSFRRDKIDSVTKRFSVTGHSEAPGNNPPEIIVALKEGSVFNAYVGGNGNVQINYKFCDHEGDAVFTIVDWGDGNREKYGATYSCVGKGTNHIYTSSGNYTITLLIYDEFGKGYVMKRNIYIAPSPGSGGGWTSETQIAQAQVDPEGGSYSVIGSFKTVSTAGSGYTPTPIPQPEPQSSQSIIAGDPGCPTISAQELLAYDKNKNQKIDSDEVMQIVDDLISGKITFESAKKLNQAIQKQCKVSVGTVASSQDNLSVIAYNPMQSDYGCKIFPNKSSLPSGWILTEFRTIESCNAFFSRILGTPSGITPTPIENIDKNPTMTADICNVKKESLVNYLKNAVEGGANYAIKLKQENLLPDTQIQLVKVNDPAYYYIKGMYLLFFDLTYNDRIRWGNEFPHCSIPNISPSQYINELKNAFPTASFYEMERCPGGGNVKYVLMLLNSSEESKLNSYVGYIRPPGSIPLSVFTRPSKLTIRAQFQDSGVTLVGPFAGKARPQCPQFEMALRARYELINLTGDFRYSINSLYQLIEHFQKTNTKSLGGIFEGLMRPLYIGSNSSQGSTPYNPTINPQPQPAGCPTPPPNPCPAGTLAMPNYVGNCLTSWTCSHQTGTPPASGTPIEAVNPDTFECRQFNSRNEIPSGWEELFPGETCADYRDLE